MRSTRYTPHPTGAYERATLSRKARGFTPSLRRRVARRALVFALLLDHSDGKDRGLVKEQRRDRKRKLAEYVRRRQDRRDDEDEHDRVAPLRFQECGIDDADAA